MKIVSSVDHAGQRSVTVGDDHDTHFELQEHLSDDGERGLWFGTPIHKTLYSKSIIKAIMGWVIQEKSIGDEVIPPVGVLVGPTHSGETLIQFLEPGKAVIMMWWFDDRSFVIGTAGNMVLVSSHVMRQLFPVFTVFTDTGRL